jgi:hypothetical protein
MHGTSTLIVLKQIYGNPPTQFMPLQTFLQPYVTQIKFVWMFVYIVTAAVVIGIVIKEYRSRKK